MKHDTTQGADLIYVAVCLHAATQSRIEGTIPLSCWSMQWCRVHLILRGTTLMHLLILPCCLVWDELIHRLASMQYSTLPPLSPDSHNYRIVSIISDANDKLTIDELW